MKIYSFFLVITTVLSLSVKAQFSGHALYFDGVDDYVSMGQDTIFNVGNGVTYEAWINPDTTFFGVVINKWSNFFEDKQFGIWGNSVMFYLHNVFGGVHLVSSPSIPLHQYTHIAATYDDSTRIAKIYINGVLDTSKSVGSGVSNSSEPLFIGSNPARFGNTMPFKGIIDELRIWNIARTDSAIQSTMNQSLNGNEEGLIAYWKFDEGTGTITFDATSNQNHGTINGATWFPGTTSADNEKNFTQPDQFSLGQNYPNPFNPSTTIKYSIPTSEFVSLKVFDVLGNEVATLVNEEKPAGVYEVEFRSSVGNVQLASGIYFYRLTSGSFVETKKMQLLK